jgi:bacteriorhodopsin
MRYTLRLYGIGHGCICWGLSLSGLEVLQKIQGVTNAFSYLQLLRKTKDSLVF